MAGNFPGGMLLKKIGFRKGFPLAILSSGVLELFTPLVAYRSFYLTLVIRVLIGFFHVRKIRKSLNGVDLISFTNGLSLSLKGKIHMIEKKVLPM